MMQNHEKFNLASLHKFTLQLPLNTPTIHSHHPMTANTVINRSTPNSSKNPNPSTNASTATVNSDKKAPQFAPSATWATIGTIVHLMAAIAAVALIPFGGKWSSGPSYLSPLFDLVFTDSLKDYAEIPKGVSMVGPALLATLTRPLNLVFDERVRTFLVSKALPKIVNQLFPKNDPTAIINSISLYVMETRTWTFLAARLILATVWVLSLAALRSAMCQKFKSHALPRIFSSLCLAAVIPFIGASGIHAATFSGILVNFALSSLISGHLNRTFSILTVNAVIFDIFSGSALLFASFTASLFALDSFKPFKAALSVLVTFPVALTVSVVFDSLFYNKFIWPQGEALYTVISALKPLPHLNTLSLNAILHSKLAFNLAFTLAPAFLIYLLAARSNRYIRLLITIYTISTLISLGVFGSSLSSTCGVLLIPLLMAASLAIFSFIRTNPNNSNNSNSNSNSNKSFLKYFTIFIFATGILPGIFWSLGRTHFNIAKASQYTGQALMALNSKIIKNAQEGVPTRVLVDPTVMPFGYNRFLQLDNKFALYASSPASNFRPDYLVASLGSCPGNEPIKSFAGFEKINLKSLSIAEIDQVALFRYSSEKCKVESEPKNNSQNEPSKLSLLVSSKFLDGKFASQKEQADFIAQHLGKFNHKKISNSIALIAYLYANAIEQI
jgi:hypothetical protein